MTRLSDLLDCPAVMVTRGRRGTLLATRDHGIHSCPALATEVVERVGAGDAVFAITSLAVFAGLAPDITGFLGNLAGSQAVATMGNRSSVRRQQLAQDIDYLMDHYRLRKAS